MTRSTLRRRTSFRPARATAGSHSTGAGIRLGRTSSWALLAVLALATVAFVAVDTTELWTWTMALELLALLSCALFAWRGWVAASLLMGIGVVAGFSGRGLSHAVVLAMVYGLVVYTCTRPVAVAYAVVVAALLAAAAIQGIVTVGGAIMLVTLAAASATLGLLGRRATLHRAKLHDDLERQRREVEEAVDLERQRISDELHDVVAHEITIVSMHAQALRLSPGAETRDASIRAITDSAGQALANIRRLLRMSPGAEQQYLEPQPRSLLDIVVEIQARLRSAGIPVECVFEPIDVEPPDISLNLATTLAQVAREITNNVIVHAPRSQQARVVVTITPETVGFSIWNDEPDPASATSPGGYGLARMRERVRLMNGTFSSERQPGGWLATVTLPLD